MICSCGWKYDASEHENCPMCGNDHPEYKTGIGLHNHSDDDRAARRYESLTRSVRPKPISKRRKQRLSSGQGEKELFAKIWEVRKPFCQNEACGEYLGTEAKAHFFAHIHSKGARPDLRLHPANIVLLCFMCEVASYQQGFDKLVLPEPYKSMRDQPPKFNPSP